MEFKLVDPYDSSKMKADYGYWGAVVGFVNKSTNNTIQNCYYFNKANDITTGTAVEKDLPVVGSLTTATVTNISTNVGTSNRDDMKGANALNAVTALQATWQTTDGYPVPKAVAGLIP